MTIGSEAMRQALAACAQGRLPVNVALMHVIAAAPDRASIDALLCADLGAAGGAAELKRLWQSTPQAWGLVRRLLAAVGDAPAGAIADRASHWRDVFERAAAVSPDAAAALYTLGRDDLAAAAEASIVERLDGWGLLSSAAAVVDLGCGAGRLSAALAPRVGRVIGIDVSPAMLDAGRRRCAAHSNVTLVQGSGDDLDWLGEAKVDVVLACDVLPYVVACGEEMVARVLAQATRVLRPGGHLVVLNYSYRGAPSRDRDDVSRHGTALGLAVVVDGEAAFEHWDGRAYVLVKPRP